MEARFPKQRSDLSRFRKFDPETSLAERHYVMAQFVLAIIGALLIAELYVRGGASAVLIPSVLLWMQLYAVGLLNEGRVYARRIELLRVLVAVPILYLLLMQKGVGLPPGSDGWYLVATYSIGSAAWLLLLPRTRAEQENI